MDSKKQKRISVYLKTGKDAATSYYRFYQFFKYINVGVRYNLMIPDNKKNEFFPIAIQPKWKQVYIFIYIYFRVLGNLFIDVLRKPDVVVVSRCIINKVLPYSYRLLLLYLKRRGCVIVWDIDDNIIGTEMSRKSFDWFSSLADVIIVGTSLLKELINAQCQGKIVVLPTTDGDMHSLITEDIKEKRKSDLLKSIRIIWVGTFSTLQYVKDVAPAFEKVGRFFSMLNKELHLIVICDKDLEYKPHNFIIHNIKWERKVAISQLLQSHVGIMPLEDNEGNRGKCGFKLIQYLSVGLPVIGSSVGVNQFIINSRVGKCVDELNCDEWYDAMVTIVKDPSLWEKLGDNAYKEWEANYSFESNLSVWRGILNN